MDSVLVVDDETPVRDLIARWVETCGYAPRVAESADRALESMSGQPAAVAVCDIKMPGHDGIWLAHEMRNRHPDTSVIMLTGIHELDAAVASLRAGVVDYMLKPFDPDLLCKAIERGVARHHVVVQARQEHETREAALRERNAALTKAIVEIEVTFRAALEGMLAMLTVRDPYAYEHAHRIAKLSVNLALVLGIKEPRLSEIECAALLHDVGKAALPEALLHKDALTQEDREVVRQHPQVGYEILQKVFRHVPSLSQAAELVLSSHEWYDGTGYPQRLRGGDIPIGSRIIAVVDAYDAMTHQRLYRNPVPTADAIRELSRCRGSQFDPHIVDAFLLVHGAGDEASLTN